MADSSVDGATDRTETGLHDWSNSLPSSRSNCYETHYVSPVERIKAEHSVWWISLVCNWIDSKCSKYSVYRILKSWYAHSILLLLLLAWTAFGILGLIVMFLPSTVLYNIVMMVRSTAVLIVPSLACSTLALWVGIALKFYSHKYSIKVYMSSCVLIELILEIIEHYGYNVNFAISASLLLACGVTIYIAYTSLEEHLITAILLSSSVLVRLVFVDATMLGFNRHSFMSPISAYSCLFTGMPLVVFVAVRFFECHCLVSLEVAAGASFSSYSSLRKAIKICVYLMLYLFDVIPSPDAFLEYNKISVCLRSL